MTADAPSSESAFPEPAPVEGAGEELPVSAEESAAGPQEAPLRPDPAQIHLLRFALKHDLQKRIDVYLRDRLPAYSRAMIQKLIRTGAVIVNGRPAKSSTVLRNGDTLEVLLPKARPDRLFPEDIPLNIVYEDEQLIALNKQANLIVHPARGHWSGTLINALLHHAQQTHSTLSSGSDPWRPGIIHRLDRDTTGLILIAKTDEAHWRLAGQFERRTIKKTYLAIVHGNVELDSDLIDAPLAVHAKTREKYGVRPDIGKAAQTVYTVRERFQISSHAHYTLVELAPKTGRTHQLRVHMAHIGHPIVGDSMYGGRQITEADVVRGGRGASDSGGGGVKTEDSPALITRQALHAYRLQFVHPTLFTRMHLEAPVPPDMTRMMELLRQNAR